MSCDATAFQFISSRFGPIAYLKEGSGPALVLFHGGSGSSNHWSSSMRTLSQSHTVFAFDLPGFGLSMVPPANVEIADYLNELGSLIDQVTKPEGRFNIAGFSFGAVCAAEVALRLKERIKNTVLVAPGGFGSSAIENLDMKRIPLRRPPTVATRDAAAYNLGKWMLAKQPAICSEVVDRHLENVFRTRFNSHVISLQDNITDLVKSLSGRLLVIWGEADAIVDAGGVVARRDAIAKLRPSTEFAIIPDAGHWVMQDAPEKFCETMISFLSRSD